MGCRYELQGDVRVRISTIRGDYAVLSAVAFDPVPASMGAVSERRGQ